MQGGPGDFGPLSMLGAARSTDPRGGRVWNKGWGAAEGTMAGAPLADPAACCLTPKDGLCLKAAGQLLLCNLFQDTW